MKSLFFYLVQVLVVSGILYAYYHFALRNKKFHQYNRFYILGATLASVLIPFLNIPVYFTEDDKWMYALQNLSGPTVLITADPTAEVEKPFNWQGLLYCLYALVAVAGLTKILISVYRLKKIMRQHPAEHLNGIRFINTSEPGTPFSFFRWLFWNERIELSSQKGEQIFRHEVYHIEQKHSIDSVFMEIVTIVFWINPFFHLMKKELKAIHEFLADRFASHDREKWEYAEMLLMQALNTQHSLVQPFFHNQIKRRIAMITNPQKTSHQYLRKLLVLPLGALLITLFAFSYQKKSPALLAEVAILDLEPSVVDSTPNGKLSFITVEVVTAKGKAEKGAAGVVEFRATSDTAPSPKNIIRLTGTTIQGKEPLIVLDGIRQDNIDNKVTLQQLDPNTIKSITVLKDASATSLYGEPGKNGVLVITTKNESELKNIQYEVVMDSTAKVGVSSKRMVNLQIKAAEHSDADKQAKTLDEVVVVGYATKKDKPEVVEVRAVPSNSVKGEIQEVRVQGRAALRTVDDANRIFTKMEVEPAFPGGASAWYSFLTKNLDANAPVRNKAPEGQYTVWVRMKISSDGRLSDFEAITKHGFGMEEAALRALENSPYWNPGYQNGKAINAIKNQPITFVVKGESSKLEEVTITAVPSRSVYPNPANDRIYVRLDGAEDREVTVRIVDMAGKEHLRSTIKKGTGSAVNGFDISSLAPGTYVLNMEGKGSPASSHKFVKK